MIVLAVGVASEKNVPYRPQYSDEKPHNFSPVVTTFGK